MLGGRSDGGALVATDLSPRGMAAQAAMQRAAANESRSGGAAAERQRQVLLGRVQEAYRAAGLEVPLGLGGSPVHVLQRRLRELRGEGGRSEGGGN